MPNLEKQIQKKFFDNLINQDKDFKNFPISIYQKLIYDRYYEVLSNSFPLFCEYIDEAVFSESIKLFIKNTPQTPFMWQIPNDYRKLMKKLSFFDNKFLYELLYFDWIEIELYMKEYKSKKSKKFSFNSCYKLFKSARIKRFKYDIINKKYEQKRKNFVIIYYDFDSNEVLYREINLLIYLLLKNLSEKKTINNILKEICFEHEIDFKEAKKVLKGPLKELFEKKVFIN